MDVAPSESIFTSDLHDSVVFNVENENAISHDGTKVFRHLLGCQCTASSAIKFQSASFEPAKVVQPDHIQPDIPDRVNLPRKVK